MVSLVYITSRIEPYVEWFLDSLAYQTTEAEKEREIEIIFVDRLLDVADPEPRKQHFIEAVNKRFSFRHVPPKPCVWQGSHRLTKEDWFAAANARNTGLIYAVEDHIAFLDDLSVLTGTWWQALKESTKSGKVTCGAYRKVRELKVDNGNIVHFSNDTIGVDNRFQYGNDLAPVPCEGQWLYGCSFSCPTQLLIDANGSDEACDGLGFEDCILGIRLANQGAHFQYDRRLLTYESEEAHHFDKIMRRTDKGVSPNDKSHAILALARSSTRSENLHLGIEGIKGLRNFCADGQPIPLPDGPTHDWYDGQPISEMV